MHALISAFVEWHMTDKETYAIRRRIGRGLDEMAAVMTAPDEPVFDDMTANPFPGVMHGGPVGVISH